MKESDAKLAEALEEARVQYEQRLAALEEALLDYEVLGAAQAEGDGEAAAPGGCYSGSSGGSGA